MIDRELLISKMENIHGYLVELDPILAHTTKEIVNDPLLLHASERLFQLIVDTALDINTHIIAESGFQAPEDYQSTFTALGTHRVLPIEFAQKIAPSVGLRNQIVHRYGKVDLYFMTEQVQKEIGDYKEYLKLIGDFLNRETVGATYAA